MITRGAKYFFGAALVGYLTALVYGFISSLQRDGKMKRLPAKRRKKRFSQSREDEG